MIKRTLGDKIMQKNNKNKRPKEKIRQISQN